MRKLRVAAMVITGLYSFISCHLITKVPVRAYAEAEAYMPFDAIIVPGSPYDGQQWDTIMKARILWAANLYHNQKTRNIIFSGAAVSTPYYESEVMAAFAVQMGIDKTHIYCEKQAEHSTENVYYSYLLAQKLGFKHIALATDGLQSFCLKGFTRRRFASRIYHVPFVLDSVKKYNYQEITIDGEALKLQDSWRSLRQRENIFQRLAGTLGRHIPWKQYPQKRVPEL